jgi:hypothetical protein
MATTYYTDIQKLYVAYFNRPADAAGLAYYEGVLEAAKGSAAVMAQISADFAKSTEYTAAFSGKTSAEIVDIIYTNIFGHAADDAGRKFYADNLDAKKVTVANVVQEVAKGAQGTDLTAYNNKLTAAAAFTAAVDTDAEKKGYSGDAANKIAKAFLAGVTDNASLAAATAPAALNASVATAVAAGTPFTVTGALAQAAAAQSALDAFVKATATKDVNGDTKKDAADITAAQSAAVTKVAGDLTDAAAATLYSAATTTQAVRDALVANQQAINASTLSAKQATLATDNANIAKVAGLTDAVASLTAAQASLKTATAADLAAQADLAAKGAAFEVNNGGTLTVTATAITITVGATTTTLATIGTDGKATVSTATGFDATKWTGLTDVIASFNNDVTTSINLTKATDNVALAQLGENLLDVAADAAGTITVGGTGPSAGTYTESALIAKIAAIINGTTAGTVAAGATPTLAQIQTELAVLKAAGATSAAYLDFKAVVDAEAAAGGTAALDAVWNPLLAKQSTDAAAVDAASTAISTLAKDVAALQTANVNVDALAGATATVAAYNKVLTDKGYVVVNLDSTHTSNFAGAKSDIYVFDATKTVNNTTVAAFNLQGTDILSVGSSYSLVKGAIGATGVKGVDTALEIFVSNNNGDAVLQFETHAYSSNVAATAGEIITITLTGVDATTLQLNNGIITSGTATA